MAFMSFNHVYMYTSLYSKYIKVLIFRIFSEKIDKEIHSNSTNKQVFNKDNINKSAKSNHLNHAFTFLVEL